MLGDGCDHNKPPTINQLKAEYSECADYDVSCDARKARRFLVACRRLLDQVEQAGKGTAQMRIETAKYERAIERCRDWLTTHGGISPHSRQRGTVDAVFNDGCEDGRHYDDDYRRAY